MQVKKFNKLWYRIKYQTEVEFVVDFFNLIHKGEPRRRLFCSMREYNPKFMGYWFPLGNCHINALFALFLLDYKYPNRFKIITNDKHSAIYDLSDGNIYDPTYEAGKIDFSNTIAMFSKEHVILDFDEYLATM
jgi:hypothetical protein